MNGRLRTRLFPRFYKGANTSSWRFTESGRLVLLVLLISGIIGLDTRQNLSFQIFAILLSVIILSVVSSVRRKGHYSVLRKLPTFATVGQEVAYNIEIQNNSEMELSNLLIIDSPTWQFPTLDEFNNYTDERSIHENKFDQLVGFPRWLRQTELKIGANDLSGKLSSLTANSTKSISIKLVPLRRGYIYFYGFRVSTADTFGLIRRFKKIKVKNCLLVLPKRYALPEISLKGSRHNNQNGVSLASSVGESGEFHSLREYRAGDPQRHVHWRSWAKTGIPMVKTFEQAFFVRHALVLDTFTVDLPSSIFEEAISVAASLTSQLSDQESLLDLMFINKKQYRITAGRHLGNAQYFLETLASLEPQNLDPIKELGRMVLNYTDTLSNILCIFLRWNVEREKIVTVLRSRGVNVIVLIMSNQVSDESSEDIIYLNTNNMRDSLKQLDRFSTDRSSK